MNIQGNMKVLRMKTLTISRSIATKLSFDPKLKDPPRGVTMLTLFSFGGALRGAGSNISRQVRYHRPL